MVSKFILGYSGSLAYFSGEKKSAGFFRHFWTYNHIHTDNSTRSPYYLFKAVQKLHLQKKIRPENFGMEFWGLIDERNVSQARDMGIQAYLSVEGYVSKEESSKKLEQCTALFLPLESSGIGEPLFIPGKLFEYLNSKKPVLALCESDSDAGRILEKAGSAWLCAPADVNSISGALEILVNDPSKLTTFRLNEEYIAKFRWESVAEQMAGVFRKCINEQF